MGDLQTEKLTLMIDHTVVTHNLKHFSQMPGIKCVDWVEK